MIADDRRRVVKGETSANLAVKRLELGSPTGGAGSTCLADQEALPGGTSR